ncbi:hypothetical protein PIB30_055056 [Stylosanthes scabra]|uniref:Uncharacterized protein n=1 Tax=Stylosanthes scabra TaxID=79078 RepID=A0ABU6WHI5_9FABA|nr:hypothetical protein [Stylosanthes scabra]
MSCRMILGKKYMDQDLNEKGFKAVMQEILQLAGIPNVGDYIPYIGALDLQGLIKRMKVVRKIFDEFLDKVIHEHLLSEKKKDKAKDFVDVMLSFLGPEKSEYHIEQSNIKAILLDMLVGSMDTPATAIEWAISELIKHPRVMKKLQMEFGIRGRVIINAWTIMRDPSAWAEPEEFWPERFEGRDIDIRGKDFPTDTIWVWKKSMSWTAVRPDSGSVHPPPILEVHPSRWCGGRAIPLQFEHILSSEGAHQFISELTEL